MLLLRTSINVMGGDGKQCLNCIKCPPITLYLGGKDHKNSAIMFLVIKSNKCSLHKIQEIQTVENKNHSYVTIQR